MTGDLRAAVDQTLEAIDVAPEEAAAAELARQLASEIDDAATAERWATLALRQVADDDDPDAELEELIRGLKAKVSRRDALVRVGQRLEAVLVQLQATPAARGKAASAGPPRVAGALTALRGGRTG